MTTMNEKQTLNRREFLRIAAMLGGASLFAGCTLLSDDNPVPRYIEGAPGPDPVETLKGVKNAYTVCGLCPGNCGIRCRVARGAAVKISGNPYSPIATADPLPFATPPQRAVFFGGSICPIGGSGVQTLYDPFRVAKPLKRVGRRGSGKWRALTWEQAIGEILQGGDLFGEGPVRGLRELARERKGPDVLVGRTDWGSETFIRKFVAAFPGARLLRNKDGFVERRAEEATAAVFGPAGGAVAPYYGRARLVIGFGDTPLDSGIPLVSLARRISDSRVSGRGFTWIVVDPRLSVSATKADGWIPIQPGRDHEFALGVMRAVEDEYPARARLLREKTSRLPNLGTVEEYAHACKIPSQVIRQIAGMLDEAGEAAAVIPGGGVLSQPDGLEAAQTILALNLMIGSAPGTGGLFRRNDEYLPKAAAGLLGSDAAEGSGTYGDPTECLIMWRCDPVYDDPSSAKNYFGDRKKVALSVAIDTEITETSVLADYILPDTTYLERWDICQSPSSVVEPGIGARSPVVGKIDAKTGRYAGLLPEAMVMEDILSRLAAELELRGFEPDKDERPPTAQAFFRKALTAVLDAMNESGFPIAGGETSLERVAERGGVFLPDWTPKTPGAWDVQAASPKISAPKGTRADRTKGEVFALITYSLPFHRSPRSGLNSWLLEVLPENRLLINYEDARRIGVKNLDLVTVKSADTGISVTCTAQVAPGIKQGVTAMARGFGYAQSGAAAQIVDGVRTQTSPPRGAGVNTARLSDGSRPTRVIVTKA